MALTKTEMAETLAEKMGMTKAASAAAVNFILQEMVDALMAGEKVKLAGLGVMRVAERKERYANNPQGGDKVLVPAYKTMVMRCSRDLKKALNS